MKHDHNPLNAEQLSLILGISEFTIKKLAKAKELPCTFVNRRPQFTLPTIIRHFKRLEGGGS